MSMPPRMDSLPAKTSTHELKIWPVFFNAYAEGVKRAETRLDDRGFKVGDTLHLREYNPKKKQPYTGRMLKAKILHITKLSDVPGTHKKDAKFVVLSLAVSRISRSPEQK